VIRCTLQALFRRAQLKALVGLHSSAEGLGGNLSADEISIITGALDLTSKTAWTAMTPLDKVSMGLSIVLQGP
jgi:metal transporter CNNM